MLADGASPMETEAKAAANVATEVVKKKRTKKHTVPFDVQSAGLTSKAVQVGASAAALLAFACCVFFMRNLCRTAVKSVHIWCKQS